MNRLAAALGIVVLATASTGSTDEPKHEWRFHDPIVLDAATPPLLASYKYAWLRPIDFCRTRDGYTIVVARGIKPTRALEIWREDEDRVWNKLTTLENVDYPRVVSVGDAVGVFGHSPGGDVVFRAVHGAATKHRQVVVRNTADRRLDIASIHTWKDSISLAVYSSDNGSKQPEETELWAFNSRDGGATWTGKATVAEGTDCPSIPMASFQFDDSHVAFMGLASEGEAELLLFRSRDLGQSWNTEKAQLFDGLEGVARYPVCGVKLLDGVGVFYLAEDIARTRGERRVGQLCFARSSNQATTWNKSVIVGPRMKVDEPSFLVSAAAAGKRVVVTYIDITADFESGELPLRMCISDDAGSTWQAHALEKYYKGFPVMSALLAVPGTDRILFSTSLCLDPRIDFRNYLVVQEFSGRPRAPKTLTEQDRRQIASLIDKLGDDDAKERETASRQLAAYGRRARSELLRAAESGEPELEGRAKGLLDLLFPNCINLDDD